MIESRVCPECGAAFVPRYDNQVCCGDECLHKRQLRQIRESKRRCSHARKLKLSPRQKMKINLARRDLLAPKPRTEIFYRNGIIIERRGTVPLGCHAVGLIRHNA